MTAICLYFKVHQPFQLKRYDLKSIDSLHDYVDAEADRKMVNRLADECCLPANEIIFQQIINLEGKFKVSFSISGVMLELFQQYRPDVIRSFQRLADTGCVEFLAETYYHSLSSLHSQPEFERQVKKHIQLINSIFGSNPTIFRNTELIHDNKIAGMIAGLGLKGILCEGVERILAGRNNNSIYSAPGENGVAVLLRNPALSDDIAFRFGDTNWSEHPLTAEKFADWMHSHPATTEVINLFLDYETFGIHKKPATGIFDFLAALPGAVVKNQEFYFAKPSEIIGDISPVDVYDTAQTISWEDRSGDNCINCANMMQNNTIKKIYSIHKLVMQSELEHDLDTWGRLQAADYFYNMAIGKAFDGRYINEFLTPKEVFENYTNQVADFEITLIRKAIKESRSSSRHAALIDHF